jgi:hypothetical protein
MSVAASAAHSGFLRVPRCTVERRDNSAAEGLHLSEGVLLSTVVGRGDRLSHLDREGIRYEPPRGHLMRGVELIIELGECHRSLLRARVASKRGVECGGIALVLNAHGSVGGGAEGVLSAADGDAGGERDAEVRE